MYLLGQYGNSKLQQKDMPRASKIKHRTHREAPPRIEYVADYTPQMKRASQQNEMMRREYN